jgi:hypothetical protein
MQSILSYLLYNLLNHITDWENFKDGSMRSIWLILQNILVFFLAVLLLAGSTFLPIDPAEGMDGVVGVRRFTRMIEFDYLSWTANALILKLGQASLSAPRYLTTEQQEKVVKEYIELVREIDDAEYEVELIYADPKQVDKNAALQPWQDKLAGMRDQRKVLGPVAEEIFQRQISDILNGFSLGVAGQPLPPVLYHVTPLPYALIISPRNIIRQENNISLDPNLTLDQMVALEKKVEKAENVSALVTPIGGIGIYPTMVMSTSDLPWLGEVVAHEWTHNFLTTRPLGMNYFSSAELRTINETVANIVGKEVRQEMLQRYYPEYLPKPTPIPTPLPTPGGQIQPTPTRSPQPPRFEFNKEMRITRVKVDSLLKEGKIDEAEAYMETRRKVFWDNGYLIRRLNQAYFAFHGAYADSPGGGAAGEDPVGPAVITLRSRSSSLADFLNQISWMTSFTELQKAISVSQ